MIYSVYFLCITTKLPSRQSFDTTKIVKILGSAILFLQISKRFYIFADVGKG